MKRNLLVILIISIIFHFSLGYYFISIDKYSINIGSFLSIFQEIDFLALILNITGLLVIGMLVYKEIRTKQYATELYAYALFLIGGILNLVDRISYGGVVDYFHFFSISLFNFADCLVILGIIIYILLQFRIFK